MPNRLRFFAMVAAVLVVVAGVACSADDPDSLRERVAALEEELVVSHRNAEQQQELAESFRQRLEASIGDRVVTTEGAYVELPETIVEAEAQGYALLDTLSEDGELLEAACFAHEGTLHYGKGDPRVTDGTTWHGAPFLLAYDRDSGKLIGMVLESTSEQPAPPWEYHTEGHPGMSFPHSSLHIWFTTPPVNLSLMGMDLVPSR